MERTRKFYAILEVLSGISADSNSSNFDILIWEIQASQLLLFVMTLVEFENPTPFSITCGIQNISHEIFLY